MLKSYSLYSKLSDKNDAGSQLGAAKRRLQIQYS